MVCEEVIPFSVGAATIVAILQSHPRLRFRPDKHMSAQQHSMRMQQASRHAREGTSAKEYARISRVGASRCQIVEICRLCVQSNVLAQSLALMLTMSACEMFGRCGTACHVRNLARCNDRCVAMHVGIADMRLPAR